MYDWLKALHVIAVIAWMAALLYLPRLFVYHADAGPGSAASETFKIMERRLLRGIATPAMVAVLGLGLTLAAMGGWFSSGWLLAKLVLVAGLVTAHGFFAAEVKAFAADRRHRPARFYRLLNEAPAVLMAAIVLLVILKPF